MDRFDCQYLMATFVNVYIASFIRWVSPAGGAGTARAGAGCHQRHLCSLTDVTAENTRQRKLGLEEGIFSRAGNASLTSHALLLQSH